MMVISRVFRQALTWFILLACVYKLNSQNNPLETYKWTNRILLIISEDQKSSFLSEQTALLGEINKSFEERKLLVFQVYKDKFKIEKNSSSQTVLNPTLYNTYNSKLERFKVVLIGLDGGIKHETLSPISRSELFAIIDGMPMRQAELKGNK